MLLLLAGLAATPCALAPYGPPPYGRPPCSGDERPFSGVGFNASACGLFPCATFHDCPAPAAGVTARPTCTSQFCVLACGELVGGDCAAGATCFDLGGVGVGVCLWPNQLPVPGLQALDLDAVAHTLGAAPPAVCTLAPKAGVPTNPHLFGYNLEVYGTMINNTFDDTAGMALVDALHAGTLRYPGGTMSNIWDMEQGRYDEGGFTMGSSYSEFKPFAADIRDASPVGTYSAKRFLAGAGGHANATIYDLNVFSFNATTACSKIAYIASLHQQHPGPVFLELGK
jgi:hypothetical protein